MDKPKLSKTRQNYYRRRFKVKAQVHIDDNVTVSNKNGVKYGRPPNPRYTIQSEMGPLIGKRCSVCKKIQPYHSFHKLYRSIDGHNHLCKGCKREANAKRSKYNG